MLNNQVAIITGSSQGIGKGIAKYFAKQGATVIVNYPFDSEAEKANTIVEEITSKNGKAVALKANVTNEEEVKRMINEIINKFGQLDILVNNAGITRDSTAKKMTVENFKMVLDTNLVGSFITSRIAAEVMAAHGYGRIINTSSIAGQQGNFGQANYAASKSGVLGLTKTFALEYAKKGVTVNAISPGFIKTPMTEAIPEDIKKNMISEIPVRRIGEPEDVASAAAFLASEQAGFITGQLLPVNGGLYM